MFFVMMALWGCSSGDGGPVDHRVADETGEPSAPGPTEPGDEPAARAGVPAILGGNVVAEGPVAFASDTEGDQVVAFDTATGSVQFATSLDPGDQPGRLLLTGDALYVGTTVTGAVVSLDRDRGDVLWRTEVCSQVRGLAERGDVVLASCADGVVAHVDGAGRVVDRWILDPDLGDIVVQGDRVYVARFRSAEVIVLGLDGTLVEQLTLPGYTATVTKEGRVARRTFTPRVARRMVEHPDGGVVVLHQRHLDQPVNTNVEQEEVPPESCYYCPEPRIVGCLPGIAHGALTRVLPDLTVASSTPLEGVTLPLDLLVESGDDVSYHVATLVGAAEADVLTYGDRQFAARDVDEACIPGVAAPHASVPRTGIALAGDLLVGVSQAPFAVHARSGTQVLRDTVSPGQAIFHQITRAELSCANCHPNGLDDGHTWDFTDIGPRRTQPIAIGGILETAPFHWGGDLPNMIKLTQDVYQQRMGGEVLGLADLDAIATFMDELPVASPGHTDVRAAARGAELFADAEVGCATCHVAPLYTDNAFHDVGTGTPLQTPSLVGVGSREPLLHDGCADTIEERLVSCGSEAHGQTAHLSEAQRADLAAFVRSL